MASRGPINRQPIAALMDAINIGRYPFWFPLEARGKAIDYFVYPTSFTPLLASATTLNAINIQGDSAFIIISGVIVETDTLNTTFLTYNPLLVTLTNTGASSGFSAGAVHANNWFGTADSPKMWDMPKLLAPNSSIGVQLQNLEAVNRNVHVAFHGIKIYGFAP
jgi:hypothetical protein